MKRVKFIKGKEGSQMCRQLKVCTRPEGQFSYATEFELGSGQSSKGNLKNQKVQCPGLATRWRRGNVI